VQWSIFVAGVPWCSGQTSSTPSLRDHVVALGPGVLGDIQKGKRERETGPSTGAGRVADARTPQHMTSGRGPDTTLTTLVCMCMYARVLVCLFARVCLYARVCVEHTKKHTLTQTHIRKHIHTRAHAHIHTRKYIHFLFCTRLFMRGDFVRPANRVLEHKALCLCMSGPCFLCALVYFIAGVTCWLGQTSDTLSLRGDVVSLCMNARAHTRIRAHFCTHACLLAILPAVATCCCRLPHLRPLLTLQKPGPHAHLCLPLCAALCNRRSARVPQPLPRQPAATGLVCRCTASTCSFCRCRSLCENKNS